MEKSTAAEEREITAASGSLTLPAMPLWQDGLRRAARFLYCPQAIWPFLASRVLVIPLTMLLGLVPGLVREAPVQLPAYLRLFVAWDGWWYTRIAEYGYHAHFDRFPDYVWFPIYPLLIRAFSFLTFGNYLVSAILVSNLCLMLALVFVFRYTELVLGRRLASRTVLYLIAFPLTFVFSMAYPAALMLLLVCAAFYLAQTRHWSVAGVAGMMAAATNPRGFSIVLPLLLIYLRQKGVGFHLRIPRLRSMVKRFDRRVLWLGLIPLGIVAYYTYLYFLTGNFFADINGESHFGRSFGFFIGPIADSVRLLSHGSVLALTDLFFIGLYAWLLVYMVRSRRFRPEHILLAALFVLIPLSTGQSDGIGRYGMDAFPFLWALSFLGDRPLFHRLYLAAAPALALVLLVLVGTPMFVP